MTKTSGPIGAIILGLAMGLSMANPGTAGQTSSLAIDSLEWVEAGPGIQFAQVWGDWTAGEYGMVIKFKAGFSGDKHSHSFAYHGIGIQGTWVHTFGDDDARPTMAGGYIYQAEGDVHSDACMGPEDCLIYVNQLGPQDFIPAE